MNEYIESTKEILVKLGKTAEDGSFTFWTPLGQGNRVVHRVRVELSRIRAQLANEGKRLKPFKLQAEVVPDKENNRDVVTLTRRKPGSVAQKVEEIRSVLGDLVVDG